MLRTVSFLTAVTLLVSAMAFGQANMKVPEKKEKKQAPPAAQPAPSAPVNEPVVGKTAEHAQAIVTSSTASTGVATPGWQTTNGMAQQPDQFNVHPENPKPAFGAPPNWEQVGQDEALANSNAAAAYRAELNGPEGSLGIGNNLASYANPKQPTGSTATRTNQAKPALTPSNERRAPGQRRKSTAPPQ